MNDFTTSSGTGVAKELAGSSSLMWSDDGLEAALSLALRRKHRVWGRAEGAKARGNDLARYLDGSLAAILGGGIGVVAVDSRMLAVQKLFAGAERE